MKVRAIRRFFDRAAVKIREEGEEFTVTSDRYQKLKLMQMAVEVPEEKKTEKEKTVLEK